MRRAQWCWNTQRFARGLVCRTAALRTMALVMFILPEGSAKCGPVKNFASNSGETRRLVRGWLDAFPYT